MLAFQIIHSYRNYRARRMLMLMSPQMISHKNQ